MHSKEPTSISIYETKPPPHTNEDLSNHQVPYQPSKPSSSLVFFNWIGQMPESLTSCIEPSFRTAVNTYSSEAATCQHHLCEYPAAGPLTAHTPSLEKVRRPLYLDTRHKRTNKNIENTTTKNKISAIIGDTLYWFTAIRT